ncbi:MAG: transporter [Eubacteriales bacterium]|nr:transporter [Eubacteriales bacterium]
MNSNEKKKKLPWVLFVLHLSLMVSSISGVLSKKAAAEEFLSVPWMVYYAGVLLIMLLYAVVWQQILKYLPLSVAYSNKPVGLAWGMIWGAIFFQEKITWNMILGAIVIFIGIYMVVTADE